MCSLVRADDNDVDDDVDDDVDGDDEVGDVDDDDDVTMKMMTLPAHPEVAPVLHSTLPIFSVSSPCTIVWGALS